ncbi:hypothetical protein K440DRAFT_628593 [Wilcoxina mikolae CBS 423.85]|nr:hypothetical protein K440DRAFT_628593 [Wilcoxina mikolae CBS 423.85]
MAESAPILGAKGSKSNTQDLPRMLTRLALLLMPAVTLMSTFYITHHQGKTQEKASTTAEFRMNKLDDKVDNHVASINKSSVSHETRCPGTPSRD